MATLLMTAAVLCAEPVAAGAYKGKYEGTSGGGDIKISLALTDGKWNAEAGFGLGGQEVKCKVLSVKVDGSKMQMVYSFDLGGTVLQSSIEGEMKGTTLAGTYKTKATADGSAVDEGTWTATSAN